MPKITKVVDIPTDENGSFNREELLDPPGPFGFTIQLTATLISPAETTVTGSIDIYAAVGSSKNPRRAFTISTGEQISLGTWKIDASNNGIVFTGQTSPIQANATVVVELVAEL